MAKPERAKRIADRIQAEAAEVLQRSLADPRLGLVTITDVNVDRELAHATLFVSSVDDAPARQAEILRALRGARGLVRRELAARLQLRSVPQLHFEWDPSPARGQRLTQLLDELGAKAEAPEQDSSDDDV